MKKYAAILSHFCGTEVNFLLNFSSNDYFLLKRYKNTLFIFQKFIGLSFCITSYFICLFLCRIKDSV